MDGILALAADNLLSPIILFFALGFGAAFARSDLSVPEAIAKGMSLYLLFAIGFKGGASVAAHGIDSRLVLSLLAGGVLSFVIPFIAFSLLRAVTRLNVTDAAAVAAHYGSISIVTFVAGTSVAETAGFSPEGYMVAVAAVMEAPAILSALWLVARYQGAGAGAGGGMEQGLIRE
ncbi:MAG: sodium-dependent bicarbonate transport family permease, partial [Pseudomonadota bacterium]